jgi:hypothetical protein
MLDMATAVSTRTKIRMVHPQWDDDQVNEEIDAIAAGGAVLVDDLGPAPLDLTPTEEPVALAEPDVAPAV